MDDGAEETGDQRTPTPPMHHRPLTPSSHLPNHQRAAGAGGFCHRRARLLLHEPAVLRRAEGTWHRTHVARTRSTLCPPWASKERGWGDGVQKAGSSTRQG